MTQLSKRNCRTCSSEIKGLKMLADVTHSKMPFLVLTTAVMYISHGKSHWKNVFFLNSENGSNA